MKKIVKVFNFYKIDPNTGSASIDAVFSLPEIKRLYDNPASDARIRSEAETVEVGGRINLYPYEGFLERRKDVEVESEDHLRFTDLAF